MTRDQTHTPAAPTPPRSGDAVAAVLRRLREDVTAVAADPRAAARIARAATALRLRVAGDPDAGLVLVLGPEAVGIAPVDAPADGTITAPTATLAALWERPLGIELLEGRAASEGRVRPALMVLPVLAAAARRRSTTTTAARR